ncbi:efflux RND transporter periplasmic adaptor subunit [Pseudaeromonas paramecii]|uniref:Efflux RND transporter periplasmic adaptor subunit n=1 Tax=Pseudaeromonas paramecii TaxID=2138166 RepID=A0ABP8QIY7_9GAMM
MGSFWILLPRLVATLALVGLAALAGVHLFDYYQAAPWTRDARVRTELIRLTSDVAGFVSEVRVADNQLVHQGDLLFVVDKSRYALAVADAEANVARLTVSAAQKARDARRTQRLDQMVSQAAREQSQSEAQVAAAELQQAKVALQQAQLDLARTEIRAPCDGYVTNFSLHVGDYQQAGSPALALLSAKEFYVVGYFEETKLPRIQVGDPVEIRLMGIAQPLTGQVSSIAGGIQDDVQSGSQGELADVSPTFEWVRLAQRIPVRITLDPAPEGGRLVAGQTASVTVLEDETSRLAKRPEAAASARG